MTKAWLICLSLVGLAHLFIEARTLASYGAMELGYNHVPWFPYNKPIYSTYPPYTAKPSWYPIAGPYTYGPPTTSPTGFHQQQIVHIHDVGPPDVPHGDSYQEGVDYNINNVINNIEAPLDDLSGVASSRVETRKQKPKSRIKPTTASSRKSTSKNSNRNNSKTQKRVVKIQQSRNNKTRRRKPEPIKSTTTRKNSRGRSPERLSYEQKKKVQRRSSQRRSSSQRRRARPTRRTYSRNPYYDDRDYDDFYVNGQRRRYKDYRNYETYNDYELSSEEDLARQDDATTDYDNDSGGESTTEAATTMEAATTAETTTVATGSTTEAPETTEMTSTETTTMMFHTQPPSGGYDYHFEGYGPSNGNENISITYSPEIHGRTDFDNYWYLHQGSPENAHYQNYFLNSGILK